MKINTICRRLLNDPSFEELPFPFDVVIDEADIKVGLEEEDVERTVIGCKEIIDMDIEGIGVGIPFLDEVTPPILDIDDGVVIWLSISKDVGGVAVISPSGDIER